MTMYIPNVVGGHRSIWSPTKSSTRGYLLCSCYGNAFDDIFILWKWLLWFYMESERKMVFVKSCELEQKEKLRKNLKIKKQNSKTMRFCLMEDFKC